MYFITKRDSETGKKFADYEAKRQEAFKASRNLVFTEIGATEFRESSHFATGGISALIFGSGFEIPKHFKEKKKGEYMPRVSTKEGRELQNKIDSLPTVSTHELNMCIGFKDKGLRSIGFDPRHNYYFIFSVLEKWNVKIPDDCEEITVTRYKELVPEDSK